MKVLLAGFNVDKELLDEINKDKKILTPETISAAYARISRDPRPVNELRYKSKIAVEKARKSNENIVFGMGHASIAEHSVFNIDIIGVSRLLVELIESHRLCSYTEKSQRYIKINDDFIVPDEILGTRCQKVFTDTIKIQNEAYHQFYNALLNYYKSQNLEMTKEEELKYDNMAKEDARYVLSMSTTAQLGMTINARNIELMIRKLLTSRLIEAKKFAKKLYNISSEIAPSLIKYTTPSEYEIHLNDKNRFSKILYEKLMDYSSRILEYKNNETNDSNVELINCTDDAFMIANVLYPNVSFYMSFLTFYNHIKNKVFKVDNMFWKNMFKDLNFHNSLSREFEHISMTFNIKMSASCFAQFKRHRILSMNIEPYSFYYSPTIPQSFVDAGLESEFKKIIDITNNTYAKIEKDLGSEVASYILTNAHNRRVNVTLNARELYAMSRLRMDEHAQWDIKNVVTEMVKLVKEKLPMTFALACGKSEFEKVYNEFMEK